MSCDFELKKVVSYIDRRLMYAEAKSQTKGVKTKEIEFSTRWLSRIFKIFWFWPPKFQKTSFSGKNALKSKIFKIFKKSYYMYRKHTRVVRMPIFKFVSHFLTPNDCNKCEMWWRHKNKSHFCAIYRHRTQKQITSLDSWDETKSEKNVLFSKFWILKIDLFDVFWPDLEVKSENYLYHWILRLKLPIRDFHVVFLMMTSCDLTVTLTCT